MGEVRYCTDPYEAAQDAEAILVVTEWDEFRNIDWDRVRGLVERALVLDGRNALDGADLNRHGFHYVSIGRPPLVLPSGKSDGNDAAVAKSERMVEAL